MKYSNKLKAAVDGSGVLQKDIAADMGLSEGSVSNLLNGKVRLTIEDADRVLECLRKRTGRSHGFELKDIFGKRSAAS